MEQDPSRKDNNFDACQDIPTFYKIREIITAVKSAHQMSLS